MATINQIKKQIETANKRLEENNERVTMYANRIEKGLAKVAKYTGKQVTVDNYESALNLKGLNTKDWDLYFSLSSAIYSKAENEHNVLREQRNIKHLTETLQSIEDEQRKKEEINKPLENALRVAMNDFRVVWFDKMIDWYGKHYDAMRKALKPAKSRRERAKVCENHFDTMHRWYEYKKVRKYLEVVIGLANETIYDDANKYEKPEYMENAKKELAISWEKGIEKFAIKCRKFGVDEKNITVSFPTLTEKGFEVMLQDNRGRIIDARIIWAAEYSEYVCPHTRYIVTERKIR